MENEQKLENKRITETLKIQRDVNDKVIRELEHLMLRSVRRCAQDLAKRNFSFRARRNLIYELKIMEKFYGSNQCLKP